MAETNVPYHWVLGMNPPKIAPNYYDIGGISTLDFIKAKLTMEEYRGFLKGNIIKYTSRCNYKGVSKDDAKKLADYSRWHEESYDDNSK